MVDSKKQLQRGLSVDIVIAVLKIALGFIMVPVYLHYLGSEGFGFYLTVQGMVAILSLVDIGMGMYVVKKMSNPEYYRGHALKVLPSMQVFQYILGAFFVVLGFSVYEFRGYLVSPNIASNEDAVNLFAILWVSVVLKTTFSLLPSMIRAKQYLVFLNVSEFLIILLSFILGTYLLHLGRGMESLGWAFLFINIIFYVIYYLKLRADHKCRFLCPNYFDIQYIKDGALYVKSFILLVVSKVSKSSIFVVLIGSFQGVSSVPMYNITSKMPFVFPELMARFTLNFFSRYSMLYEQGKIVELGNEYRKMLSVSVHLTVFITISLYCLNLDFISGWVGQEYFLGEMEFYLILFSTALLLIESYTGIVLQVTGRFGLMPIIALFEVFFLLLLCYILRGEGMAGMLFAFAISIVPSFIYLMVKLYEVLSINIFSVWKDAFRKSVFLVLGVLAISFTMGRYFEASLFTVIIEAVLYVVVLSVVHRKIISSIIRKDKFEVSI